MTEEQKAILSALIDLAEDKWLEFCTSYEMKEGKVLTDTAFDSMKKLIS